MSISNLYTACFIFFCFRCAYFRITRYAHYLPDYLLPSHFLYTPCIAMARTGTVLMGGVLVFRWILGALELFLMSF